MKLLIAVFALFIAGSALGAFPPYSAFRGAGGIFVTTNPPNGLIIIDGTAISGSAAAGGSEGSVQYNVSGVVSGDTNFQYVLQTVEEFPQSAKLTIHLHGATNFMNASGFGTLSADELFLYSGGSTIGARKWGINAAGDLNPITDDASYSIGTVGLNRKPFYVGVQSAFNINDRITLSASGTIWQVGNHSSWIQGQILTDGAVRMHFLSGGNVGIGTVTPTEHLTISNLTATGPMFGVYASNNPAPAMLINSNSWVGLGTNVPAARLHVRPATSGTTYVRVDDTNGTPRLQMGVYPNLSGYGSLWFGDITPSQVNYAFLGDGVGKTFFNGVGGLAFSANGVERWDINTSGHLVAFADNTYGIGAASANRPAYLHLGGGGAGTVGLNVGSSVFSVTNSTVLLGAAVPILGVDTVDGSDTKWLTLSAGSTASVNRGPQVSLYGNEHSTLPGVINLSGGNVSAGDIFLSVTPYSTGLGLSVKGSTGNVGIGTNAPLSRLHVRPTTSGQSYFRIDDTNGTPRVQMGVAFSLSERGTIWLGDVTPTAANQALFGDGLSTYMNGSNNLNFVTRGNGRWTVDSSGHFVGFIDNTYDIGAAAASRPRAVHIAGGGVGTVGLTVGGTLYVTNGNVGVGTVAPIAYGGYKNVAINGTTGGIIDLMASGDVAGQFFANATEFRITAGTNRPFVVHTGITSQQERFQVSAEGNVAVGTNAPSSRLHVRPTTSGTSYLRVDDTNGTPRFQTGVLPTASTFGTIHLGDIVPAFANYSIAGNGASSYVNGTAAAGFAINGIAVWSANVNGHLLAGTDNTYDIGASGATRPRNIHVGTTIALAGNLFLDATIAGCFLLRDPGATNFVRIQLGGTTAAFPGLGRTNGHVSVMGANGAVDGTSTNGLWVMGGPIIQDFTVTAPAAPQRQGAVYWNDGTNVCVVLRNGAGALSTNKLSMTAWP